MKDMTFERYLCIDLFFSLFIILPRKSFYNKIEIILYRPFFCNNLFFPEFSNRNIRVDKLSKLIFRYVHKLLSVIQKWFGRVHKTFLLLRKLLKIDFNQPQKNAG